MIEKFKDAFREEAVELLANLEATLLELETNPRDMETISAVFRTMHTIKGSSAMFGFDDISRFTHEVESIMSMLREGAFIADKRLVDLTLQARDYISLLLQDNPADIRKDLERLIAEFKAHAAERTSELAAAREAGAVGADRLDAEAPAALKPAAPPRAEAEPAASAEAAAGSIAPPGPSAADAAADSGLAGSSLVAAVRPASPADSPAAYAPGAGPAAPAPSPAASATFSIHFAPSSDVFLNGTRPLRLLDEVCSLGDASVVAAINAIPPLSQLDPEKCFFAWDITLTTDRGEDAIRDVFIFVEGAGELEIRRLGQKDGGAEEPIVIKRIGEILVERGVTTEDRIRGVVDGQKKIGEILIEERVATADQVRNALDEQEHLKRLKDAKAQQEAAGTASIRVASDKLDALVDLVGELVTLQARLSRTAGESGDSALAPIAEQFERLVTQLRDNTMSIRMLPIGTTFSRFRRLVRDVSAELGKEIDLVTDGAETELDKTVIEKLSDPLIHLIRNSVDHGIEAPSRRLAAGKNARGTVTLSAIHSGAHVLISVQDDGGGLDAERIYAKAVERELVPPGTVMSESEIFNLIFAPGFSTAQTITAVSGRGVGMDVVKRQIDALGGSVSIESQRGKGLSVTLKIPLTLAIIDGLLVRIAEEHYVVPLAAVDGCIELRRDTVARSGGGTSGRTILNYRNEILPYAALRSLFETPGTAPEIEQIVVVNVQDSRLGFIVDQVVGDYQTVIKPLGRMFRQAAGLSGATILGDGTVALILDVNRLALVAQSADRAAR
jgi:two-component system chemotaxis sensor kinase CheA